MQSLQGIIVSLRAKSWVYNSCVLILTLISVYYILNPNMQMLIMFFSPNVAAEMCYSECLNQEPPGHLHCNPRQQSPLSPLYQWTQPRSHSYQSPSSTPESPHCKKSQQKFLHPDSTDKICKGRKRQGGAIQLRNTATSSDRPAVIETIRQGENFHQLQSIPHQSTV